MLIDTHIHLDAAAFDSDRAAQLAAARALGVAGFVVPAVAADNFGSVLALAAAHSDVHAALGIHPLYVSADGTDEKGLAQLAQLLTSEKLVAVGEIGLDYYVADVDRAAQEKVFVAQLRLAREHGLPVLLHSRRAVDAVLKQLRRIGSCGGVAHAFNGSEQQAAQFIAQGFVLGFGGSMTYQGSRRIRRLAATLPLDAIVLETDAPDMAPSWAAGERNEAHNLHAYAGVLAELRGISVAEVIARTGANARRVLALC